MSSIVVPLSSVAVISPRPSDEVRCVLMSANPLPSISRSYLLRSAVGAAGSRFLFHALRLPSLNDRPRPWTVTHALPFHAVASLGKIDGHRRALVTLVFRDGKESLAIVRRLREHEIGRVGQVLLVIACSRHDAIDRAVEADIEASKRSSGDRDGRLEEHARRRAHLLPACVTRRRAEMRRMQRATARSSAPSLRATLDCGRDGQRDARHIPTRRNHLRILRACRCRT